jgi:hypothetical protein
MNVYLLEASQNASNVIGHVKRLVAKSERRSGEGPVGTKHWVINWSE